MAKLYVVQNASAGAATAPNPGVTTSATLFTLLQLLPDTQFPLKVVEWGVSFNGAALAAAFPIDLVETGTVVATVTTFVAGDVMPYDDPNAPVNTAGGAAGASGQPLRLSTSSTSSSGFTSSAEGSITASRVFDAQLVDPVAGYSKQFPLGREPAIKPGNVLRVRVHGDGVVKAVCYVVFEV
jgi:hypothetical protein